MYYIEPWGNKNFRKDGDFDDALVYCTNAAIVLAIRNGRKNVATDIRTYISANIIIE
jgi:hypothetical protein